MSLRAQHVGVSTADGVHQGAKDLKITHCDGYKAEGRAPLNTPTTASTAQDPEVYLGPAAGPPRNRDPEVYLGPTQDAPSSTSEDPIDLDEVLVASQSLYGDGIELDSEEQLVIDGVIAIAYCRGAVPAGAPGPPTGARTDNEAASCEIGTEAPASGLVDMEGPSHLASNSVLARIATTFVRMDLAHRLTTLDAHEYELRSRVAPGGVIGAKWYLAGIVEDQARALLGYVREAAQALNDTPSNTARLTAMKIVEMGELMVSREAVFTGLAPVNIAERLRVERDEIERKLYDTEERACHGSIKRPRH